VRNLTARLVVLLMLALLGITGLLDYMRLARERERLEDETRRDVQVFAETLALAVSRNVRWGRTSAELRELLEDILARPGLVAVSIFDPEGRVIAETAAEGAPTAGPDDLVRRVLADKRAAAALAPGPRAVLRRVQPVRWPGGRTGALEVRQTLADAEMAFWQEVKDRVLWRLVVLVAFLLSIAALTRWSIARPIRALIRGAEALGRGDLGLRLPARRRDELGQLAHAFNRMAADLEAARRQLVRDADERLRLEQDVQQAQKLASIGRLAAELAHEIGTPLNVVAGRAEGLERLLPADHPGRRHVQLIRSQTDRLGEVVRSLLDYSRPRRPALAQEAVTPVVARAAELLLDHFRAKDVRVRLELPPGLPPIRGDAGQLRQVFLNLLLNALDAAPRGSFVRVTVGPEPVLAGEGRLAISRGAAPDDALALHVVDHGPGIPPDRLPHVFQPSFSAKRSEQGLGLSLPIVEDIVRAHQGAIEVATVPGRGTEVTVWVPLADERRLASPGASQPAGGAPAAGGC
jgi:two-component system NtrC family sensor kinase